MALWLAHLNWNRLSLVGVISSPILSHHHCSERSGKVEIPHERGHTLWLLASHEAPITAPQETLRQTIRLFDTTLSLLHRSPIINP